jgi:hypothetical protein
MFRSFTCTTARFSCPFTILDIAQGEVEAQEQQERKHRVGLSRIRKGKKYAVASSCYGPDRGWSSSMAGGSLHPHGKFHKVNIKCRGDNRCCDMAVEYFWAHALPH